MRPHDTEARETYDWIIATNNRPVDDHPECYRRRFLETALASVPVAALYQESPIEVGRNENKSSLSSFMFHAEYIRKADIYDRNAVLITSVDNIDFMAAQVLPLIIHFASMMDVVGIPAPYYADLIEGYRAAIDRDGASPDDFDTMYRLANPS